MEGGLAAFSWVILPSLSLSRIHGRRTPRNRSVFRLCLVRLSRKIAGNAERAALISVTPQKTRSRDTWFVISTRWSLSFFLPFVSSALFSVAEWSTWNATAGKKWSSMADCLRERLPSICRTYRRKAGPRAAVLISLRRVDYRGAHSSRVTGCNCYVLCTFQIYFVRCRCYV